MKVYFFESNPEDEAALRALISENSDLKNVSIEAVFLTEPLNATTVDKAQDAEVVSTFVHSVVDATVLGHFQKLKLVVTRSTGFDNIDIAAAKEKGITVSNVPAYGSRTVAEYAFSLILGLSRKTFAAVEQIKGHHEFSITGFEGFNLQGKTLGIIGTGRIGLNVAQIAKGFDMRVLGVDAFPNTAAAARIGFTYDTLEAVLAAADVITVHVPYVKTTHHLLNDAAFGKMKKGVLLVNTSRGEVIDTEALIRALDQKIVAAAGLDVIEGERDLADEWSLIANHQGLGENASKILLEDHVLIDRPEVFITPHIAFFTKEAKHEILQTSIANMAAFFKNEPINIVK